MKAIERRLKDLEQATTAQAETIQVIFYDIEQGMNPEDIHPGARVVLWLPKKDTEHES